MLRFYTIKQKIICLFTTSIKKNKVFKKLIMLNILYSFVIMIILK